jgi:hypothetical protein
VVLNEKLKDDKIFENVRLPFELLHYVIVARNKRYRRKFRMNKTVPRLRYIILKKWYQCINKNVKTSEKSGEVSRLHLQSDCFSLIFW